MGKIIAICGMAGAGKSVVSNVFEEQGLRKIHLGVTELVLEKYGKTTEELERKHREEERAKHGMAAMIIVALPKIREALGAGKNVVIDNLYSWSEYKKLADEFGGNFHTIAIHAAPHVRYQRLENREDRSLSPEEAKRRDHAEIEEIEKGGPIAMADFNIINESLTFSALKQETWEIFNKIITI